MRNIIRRVSAVLLVALMLAMGFGGLAPEPSYGAISASSVTEKNVGYGVRDLKVKNPISSCKITAPSSATKGKAIKIYFSAPYGSSQSASANFLHDGWHKGVHTYEATRPVYTWSIKDASGKVLASAKSSKSTSTTFTPTATGTITINCSAYSTCTPKPKYAYVGITHWTSTEMPSFDFMKKSVSVQCEVKKGPSDSPVTPPETEEETTPKPRISWLSASVSHTPLWDARRKNYNKVHNKKREANVYWAGEKLVLKANSDSYVYSVTATINGTNYSTSLTRKNGVWTGSLWKESMKSHWAGKYPATVTVNFSGINTDGMRASDSVKIVFSENVYSDIMHRAV